MPLQLGEVAGMLKFYPRFWMFFLITAETRTTVWYRWDDVIPPKEKDGEYTVHSGIEPYQAAHGALEMGEPIPYHRVRISEEILDALRIAALVGNDSISTHRPKRLPN